MTLDGGVCSQAAGLSAEEVQAIDPSVVSVRKRRDGVGVGGRRGVGRLHSLLTPALP